MFDYMLLIQCVWGYYDLLISAPDSEGVIYLRNYMLAGEFKSTHLGSTLDFTISMNLAVKEMSVGCTRSNLVPCSGGGGQKEHYEGGINCRVKIAFLSCAVLYCRSS